MCFLFRSSSTKGVLHRSVCAYMLIHKLSSTFYDSNMIAKVYVWLTKKKTTLKIQNCRILQSGYVGSLRMTRVITEVQFCSELYGMVLLIDLYGINSAKTSVTVLVTAIRDGLGQCGDCGEKQHSNKFCNKSNRPVQKLSMCHSRIVNVIEVCIQD